MKNIFKKQGIKLFKHNKKPYKELLQVLKKGNHNGLVVQATGSGKSNILMKLIDDNFKNKKVLYVAPTKAIYKKLCTYNDWNFPNVDFSTYYSLYKHIDDDYDLYIFDEAHRLMAEKTYKYAKKIYNKDCTVLALTATPKRLDGLDIRKDFFNESEVVESVNLFEAVDQGILPSFDYCLTVNKCEEFTDSILTAAQKKFADIKKVKNELKHCLKNNSSIENIIQENKPNAKKFLVFASTIDECNKWAIEMIHILKTNKVYVVSSDNDIDDNINIINKFDNCQDRCALISVNMLCEGVHLNNLDCVIMLRHTASERVFFQQIGRLLAFKQNNGLVIDCVSNIDLLYNQNESLIKNNNNDIDKSNSHKDSKSFIKYFKQIIYKNYNVDLCELYKDINSYKYSEDFVNDLSSLTIKQFSDKYNIGHCSISMKRKELGLIIDHRIIWTDDMIKDLSNLTIKQFSNKYNISHSSITKKRKELGLSIDHHIIWTDDMIKDLSNLTIKQFSNKYNISHSSITKKRKELGLSIDHHIIWTDDMIKDLSNLTIKQFTNKYNIGPTTVAEKRKEIGIGAHIIWTDDMIKDLSNLTIKQFSNKYNISSTPIIKKRKELGLSRAHHITWTDDMVNDLSNLSLKQFTNKYNIGPTTVTMKRKELGLSKDRIIWTDDDIIDDLSNLSLKQFSNKYKIGYSSINNKRKELGLSEPRKKREAN